MPGGSVYGRLHPSQKSNSKKLSFVEKVHILLDAAKGMVYLHSFEPPIIHRDIKVLHSFLALTSKSHNLLLDEHGRGKLCDLYGPKN